MANRSGKGPVTRAMATKQGAASDRELPNECPADNSEPSELFSEVNVYSDSKDKGVEEIMKEIEFLEIRRRHEREREESLIRLEEKRLLLVEKQLELERLKNNNSVSVNDEVNSEIYGRDNSLEYFRKQVKSVIGLMPDAAEKVPSWFTAAESTFKMFEIPKAFWVKLILPQLSVRCKTLISRLSVSSLSDYYILKEHVLKEYKLSPADFLNKLINARKEVDETWGQFSGRLKDLFDYYLDSRDVSDMDSLKKLIVADYFKSKLPLAARRYVVLQEGVKWFEAPKLASLMANFEDAQNNGDCVDDRSRTRRESYSGDRYGRMSQIARDKIVNRFERRSLGNTHELVSAPLACNGVNKEKSSRFVDTMSDLKFKRDFTCWECGKRGHLQANCPNRTKFIEKGRSVRQVGVVENSDFENKSPKRNECLTARVAEFVTERGDIRSKPQGSNCSKLQANRPDRYMGERAKFKCDGVEFEALLDSGSEISVIHENLVPSATNSTSCSKIKLVSAFGETVEAKLINLPIKREGPCGSRVVVLTCAVTNRLAAGVQALLTPEDWFLLMDNSECEVSHSRSREKAMVSEVTMSVDDSPTSSDCNFEDQEVGLGVDESLKFRSEQKEDPTLVDCWKQAEQQRRGMFLKDGLLYHRDQLYGRTIHQLVLPETRRPKVLALAHEGPWSCHLGGRKTLQRIKGSFYWPEVVKETRQYVASCSECQKFSIPKKLDRVPIAPIVRPDEAFQSVMVDVVGPIDPTSSHGHKYLLTLVDICTRWPEAVCLRTVTAKGTCEALLEIFSRLGIPQELTSDMGSNFRAEVTRELLARLGVEVRFSAPYHYEGHGIVERFNGTFRKMLAHVVNEYGRKWHTMVPYMLWAYRETPNETTGVPPFLLMYGRDPRGPLSVLEGTWSGRTIIPAKLNTSAADYLAEVRSKLATVKKDAAMNSEKMQSQYVSRYNLRARPKMFERGDLVLVQVVNPENKLVVRWDGPAEVVQCERGNSYLVKMPDRTVKWRHANRLREYKQRIASVGVAFEDDQDFGEIDYFPTFFGKGNVPVDSLVSGCDNLSGSESRELISLLQEFCHLFSGVPGRMKDCEHHIVLKPDYVPRKAKPYHIPLSLRAEVDRQIKELLSLGLITPSTSSLAHPIVCVAKREGGIRLCIDFRHLNSGTVPDAFPAAHPRELIFDVAKASFISLLDMTRGYWQIPMASASKHLTAFVTHTGLYEWTVMPFGLRNACATFQRAINRLLEPHRGYAIAYLDDIAVYSCDFASHIIHLRAVFEELERYGLTLKPEKCKFVEREVVYLGHVVGSGRHQPDPERVRSILQLSRPTTKKELRSVLGILGYYRNYIRNYSELAFPLTELTGRRVPVKIPWPEEAEMAFVRLKDELARVPKFHSPDITKPYLLFTDASNFAIGACLAQVGKTGDELPIAFVSCKLTPAQVKWSTIEKEAFSIIWALKKFNNMVFGCTVRVVSDHNPLVYLTKSTPRSPRLVRWSLALQQYDVEIVYRRGRFHINADAMSRLPGTDLDSGDLTAAIKGLFCCENVV